jgi:hypothetical protein
MVQNQDELAKNKSLYDCHVRSARDSNRRADVPVRQLRAKIDIDANDATATRTRTLIYGGIVLWRHRGQDRHRRLKSAQDMLGRRCRAHPP